MKGKREEECSPEEDITPNSADSFPLFFLQLNGFSVRCSEKWGRRQFPLPPSPSLLLTPHFVIIIGPLGLPPSCPYQFLSFPEAMG